MQDWKIVKSSKYSLVAVLTFSTVADSYTCVFRTCIFHPPVLSFSVLAFSVAPHSSTIPANSVKIGPVDVKIG